MVFAYVDVFLVFHGVALLGAMLGAVVMRKRRRLGAIVGALVGFLAAIGLMIVMNYGGNY